jgi:HK97 family phage prohead protease
MAVQKTRRMVTVGGLEWRSSDGAPTLEGYASTFDQSYNMGWYEERIAQGAFTKTLQENPDVRLLINHEGLPLGRTRSGTLQLSQDSTGLHVRSMLDPNDPDVQRLMPKIERGDVDQMSFAFGMVRQNWNSDYSQRELTELSLADGDVSIVTYPANPNTSVAFRSLAKTNPLKLREVYKQLMDEREGRSVEDGDVAKLTALLETLGTVDENVDSAMTLLGELIGLEEAEDDEATEPADDAVEEMQENHGMPVATVRARIDLMKLRGH